MHAYGMPATSTQVGYVKIDGLYVEGLWDHTTARLSVENAMKLQRQLGVAIREASGQQKMIELLDNTASTPYGG